MGLNEFLQQQDNEKIKSEEINRKERIEYFITEVNKLFTQITDFWLKSFIDNGQMIVSKAEVSITEEKLGTYTAPSLKVFLSNQEIELRPKGTVMLGTNARIDILYHDVERFMLVMAPEKMDSALQMITIRVNGESKPKKKNMGPMEWKLVNNANRMSLDKFTKELFEETLVKIVTNG